MSAIPYCDCVCIVFFMVLFPGRALLSDAEKNLLEFSEFETRAPNPASFRLKLQSKGGKRRTIQIKKSKSLVKRSEFAIRLSSCDLSTIISLLRQLTFVTSLSLPPPSLRCFILTLTDTYLGGRSRWLVSPHYGCQRWVTVLVTREV